MHLWLDVILVALCIVLGIGWLWAHETAHSWHLADIVKSRAFAQRESEFRSREATRVLQIEHYQAKIRDLEAQAGDRHAGLSE